MCLILFAWDAHPEHKLILAANRDEFYKRPTQQAHYWEETPMIFAGKDLEAGGTWMGVSKQGRFGAVTNYRDFRRAKPSPSVSRGGLVADYLKSSASVEEYLQEVDKKSEFYDGFNVLLGDQDAVFYYSNMERKIRRLVPGIYGLSNSLLDVPWPKVKKGKELLTNAISGSVVNDSQILNLLYNVDHAGDRDLPDTGVGPELEKQLSPLFIKLDDYGTRSSSLLKISRSGEFTFIERTFETGNFLEERSERFMIKG